MLIGAPRQRRGLGRLGAAAAGGESLLTRLLEGLPGVDVRIVADPSLRRAGAADRDLPQAGEESPPRAAKAELVN